MNIAVAKKQQKVTSGFVVFGKAVSEAAS